MRARPTWREVSRRTGAAHDGTHPIFEISSAVLDSSRPSSVFRQPVAAAAVVSSLATLQPSNVPGCRNVRERQLPGWPMLVGSNLSRME